MGKTGEIRVPLREDLLVEVGEVTLAADSTFCVLPSTVTLEHTIHEAPQHRLLTACFIFQQVNARKPK